jgi:hypothetical protein
MGQRVDGDMQMTTRDMEHKGQEVKSSDSRRTKRSWGAGYVLNLSVRVRVELLSERFLAKAEPSYRPNLERGTGLGGAVFRPALRAANVCPLRDRTPPPSLLRLESRLQASSKRTRRT